MPTLHCNYYNQTQVFVILQLTYLLTARLPNFSPAAGLSPPPPLPLKRMSAIAIRAPGLWITLNLNGCNARYQRVTCALVSFMRWSHLQGYVVRTESEFPSQKIILEGENTETLLFNGAVHGLHPLDRIWCCLFSESTG